MPLRKAARQEERRHDSQKQDKGTEMKVWIQKYGKVAGCMYALAATGAFWFDMKALGLALAGCALVLVASWGHSKRA